MSWKILSLVIFLFSELCRTESLEAEFLQYFANHHVKSPKETFIVVVGPGRLVPANFFTNLKLPTAVFDCNDSSNRDLFRIVEKLRPGTFLLFGKNLEASLRFFELLISDKSTKSVSKWMVFLNDVPQSNVKFPIDVYKKIANSLLVVYPSGSSASLLVSHPSVDSGKTLFRLKLIGRFDRNGINLRGDLFKKELDYLKEIYVSTFLLFPTTVPCKADEEKFCGRDAELVRTIAEHLNLEAKFRNTTGKWGDRLSNGTWTGMIGEVSRGETDLGVANMFVTQYYLERVDASYPYESTCSTFLTPAPRVLPLWMTLIRTFNQLLWIITLMTLVLGGLLITGCSNLYTAILGRSPRNNFGVIQNAMFHNCEAILGVGNLQDTSRWPIRSYISFWWLFCFILTTVYRAQLTALLSSPPTETSIDTISQLVNSQLKPIAYTNLLKEVSSKMIDSDVEHLVQRLEVVPNRDEILERLDKGKYAFFEGRNYLSSIVSSSEKNRFGHRKFRILEECLLYFPVSVALTPNWNDLKQRIDDSILRIQAAGLIRYWLDYTIWESKGNPRLDSGRVNSKLPYSVEDLQGSFLVLALGILVSFLTFLGEIMMFKIKNK